MNPPYVSHSPSAIVSLDSLPQPILDAVDDLAGELGAFGADLAKRAAKFVHDGDILLTLRHHASVAAFIEMAAETRRLRRFRHS
jgi:translation initiation factor 2B subunit (eIF-2B alpha/beta/delta family)